MVHQYRGLSAKLKKLCGKKDALEKEPDTAYCDYGFVSSKNIAR
jgi:hypothetical protein